MAKITVYDPKDLEKALRFLRDDVNRKVSSKRAKKGGIIRNHRLEDAKQQ